MRELRRPPEPTYLTNNRAQWTNELLQNWENYKNDKTLKGEHLNFSEFRRINSSLISHYRDTEILNLLFEMSFDKCAYCERPGEKKDLSISSLLRGKIDVRLDIDHFLPISQHLETTFDWNNLLPSCITCNESYKKDVDPSTFPIINPTEDNPENFFDYYFNKPVPKENLNDDNKEKAENTIGLFKLDGLINLERVELQCIIANNINHLKKLIQEFKDAKTDLRSLKYYYQYVKASYDPDKKFSTYCKCIIEDDPVFNEAQEIIILNSR